MYIERGNLDLSAWIGQSPRTDVFSSGIIIMCLQDMLHNHGNVLTVVPRALWRFELSPLSHLHEYLSAHSIITYTKQFYTMQRYNQARVHKLYRPIVRLSFTDFYLVVSADTFNIVQMRHFRQPLFARFRQR